jgi:hypothetical protein
VSFKIKRKKPAGPKGPVPVGIAWYRPWEWQRLRELAPDPGVMLDTHAEWLEVASKHLADMKQQGFLVVKVDIDVEELAAWCRQRGLPMNGAARSKFTALKVRRGEYIKE